MLVKYRIELTAIKPSHRISASSHVRIYRREYTESRYIDWVFIGAQPREPTKTCTYNAPVSHFPCCRILADCTYNFSLRKCTYCMLTSGRKSFRWLGRIDVSKTSIIAQKRTHCKLISII